MGDNHYHSIKQLKKKKRYTIMMTFLPSFVFHRTADFDTYFTVPYVQFYCDKARDNENFLIYRTCLINETVCAFAVEKIISSVKFIVKYTHKHKK